MGHYVSLLHGMCIHAYSRMLNSNEAIILSLTGQIFLSTGISYYTYNLKLFALLCKRIASSPCLLQSPNTLYLVYCKTFPTLIQHCHILSPFNIYVFKCRFLYFHGRPLWFLINRQILLAQICSVYQSKTFFSATG